MGLLQPPQSPGILTRSQEDRGMGTNWGEETRLETGSWEVCQAMGFCLVRNESQEVGVRRTKRWERGQQGGRVPAFRPRDSECQFSAFPNTLAPGKLPLHPLMGRFTQPTWTWRCR